MPKVGTVAERSYPRSKSGVAARKNYPKPEARGGGQKEQRYIQGEVAVRVQEGGEELLHVESQEGRP